MNMQVEGPPIAKIEYALLVPTFESVRGLTWKIAVGGSFCLIKAQYQQMPGIAECQYRAPTGYAGSLSSDQRQSGSGKRALCSLRWLIRSENLGPNCHMREGHRQSIGALHSYCSAAGPNLQLCPSALIGYFGRRRLLASGPQLEVAG